MTNDLFSQADDELKEKVDRAFSPLVHNGSMGVYIDGANLFHSTKLLGFRVDYIKLRELLGHYAHIRTLNYFAAENESKKAKDLNTFLMVNGYNVHVKNAVHKPLYKDGKINIAQKKNVDVDMAVYAVDNASTDTALNQFLLFTGDGDFIPVVKVLKRRGPVTIVSTATPQAPLLCRQLREECDHFIDLTEFKDLITFTSKPKGDTHER